MGDRLRHDPRARALLAAFGLLVCSLAALVALTLPPAAHASYTGPNPVLDPDNWDAVWDLATGNTTRSAGSDNAEQAITRAMFASGLIPKTSLLLTSTGTGYYISTNSKWFHLRCRYAADCDWGSTNGNWTFAGWTDYKATNDVTDTSPNGSPAGYYGKSNYSYVSGPSCGEFGGSHFTFYLSGSFNCIAMGELGLAEITAHNATEIPVGSGAFHSAYITADTAANLITMGTPPVAYAYQPYTRTVTIPSDPGSSSETAAAVRDGLLSGPPDSDLAIGKMIDGDWDGLDDTDLLEAYRPRLMYDTAESFRADAVEVMTNFYDHNAGHATDLYLNNNVSPWTSSDQDAGGYLDADFLGALYGSPLTSGAQDIDLLDAANWSTTTGGLNFGQLTDAATMHAANGGEYANRSYGRVFTGDGITLLQYWFFYYDNPKQFLDPTSGYVGDHEGDWESVQIVINSSTLALEAATYSQHDDRQTCLSDDVETTPDGRPVVYVAEGSHANYFTSGEKPVTWHGWEPPEIAWHDEADGLNSANPVDPTVENFWETLPSWLSWPGHWGAGSVEGGFESPQGPAYHDQFDSEEAAEDWTFGEEARLCSFGS